MIPLWQYPFRRIADFLGTVGRKYEGQRISVKTAWTVSGIIFGWPDPYKRDLLRRLREAERELFGRER